MGSPISFRDDYALVFQKQIGAFRESLDSEAMTSKEISEDRISILPDALLCHILSYIPTEEVVRTSILSKRWKDIWAYVPNWTLKCDEFPSSAEFIAFVDRALLIRDSAAIQKFHLDFYDFPVEDFSTIDRWICTTVRCNVVDLDLSIYTNVEELFEFPESLLTCKTLQVWKLYLNEAVKIPTLGCLPSLKSLHLEFSIASSDSMDISHCPVLEYLEISGCQGFYNFNCNISAPALKTLRISLGNEYIDREANNYLINAPQLEKLDVDEDSLSNYTFENTLSLVEANVRVFSTEDDEEDGSDDEEHAWASRATQFLAGISGVKCLTLPAPFSTGCSVAAFENLNKLTLVREDHLRWWKILWKFLERTPHLKCLVINDDGFCNRWFSYPSSVRVEKEKRSANLECFVFYHERRMYPDDPRCGRSRRSNYVVKDVPFWRPPTMVPKCLLSSLNTISICGFLFEKRLGYLDEMEMIKYLLKHGRVLEKVAIHATDGFLLEKYTPDRFWSGTKVDFCDEIELSELGSKNVRVELMERLLYLQHEDA